MLWVILGGMTLAVLGLLLPPLLRERPAAPARAAHDLEVYRDQLREIAADRERGTLSDQQAGAARLEIERRMLRAGEELTHPRQAGARYRTATAAVLAVVVPAAAAGLYLKLGQPRLPDAPLAARAGSDPRVAESRQIGDMVGGLEARLQQAPDDLQGWLLLGRSYLMLERFTDAVGAYRRATTLAPDDPAAHMGLAEAQVFAAGGQITPGAAQEFRRTLELDPRHPGARYYMALAQAQAGELRAALDGWLALAADSPPDAPWQTALQGRLHEVAAALKLDLESLMPNRATASRSAAGGPGPSPAEVAAAAALPPEQRQKMIDGMVERLAERLRENPGDFDGWLRLGRAYGVLGDSAKAREAYEKAAALRPDDPAPRQALAALGGDGTPPVGAAAQTDRPQGGAAGPNPHDGMPAGRPGAAGERSELIQGMVARLAERLQQTPEDSDGWLRLGRSYTVLGETRKAREAYAKAAALKPDDTAVLMAHAGAIIEDEGGTGGALPEEAASLYRQVLARQPDNPDALWYVGVAEIQAGRPKVALAHWERLLGQLDPKSAEYAEVQKGIGALRRM